MKKSDELGDLAPGYVNQSLSRDDIARYEAWLEKHPEAMEDVALWKSIQQIVLEQPRITAPPAVLRVTRARIERCTRTTNGNRQVLVTLLAGLAATLMVFSLLWLIVKPGVTLRWSVTGILPASFRIYRAPSGSATYTLVGEVTARDSQMVYQYRDPLLVPGRGYRYRVEGVNRLEGVALSQAVVSDPRSILPGQLSIFMTSMIMGYVCLWLIKYSLRISPVSVKGEIA